MQKSAFFPHVLMAVWALLIAASFPVAQMISPQIDAAGLTSLRFLLAALLFLPWLAWRGELSLPQRSETLRYAVLATLLVAYFWALFHTLKHSSALNAGMLYTLTPALSAGLSFFLLREKPGARLMLGMGAGLLGALWVLLHSTPAGALRWQPADALFVAGCACMAGHGVLSRLFRPQLPQQRSAAFITFWVLLLGGLAMLGLTLLLQDGVLDWGRLQGSEWGALLYLTLGATCLSFWLTQYGIKRLGPTVVMSYSYLTPALVLLLNFLFWQRPAPGAALPGVALSLLAPLLLARVRSA
ncbi:EamA family transporter [Massilia sp. W12]|uniref:DMT family transporter n=1 Tax=Massilia sp. W12 TaxID=3126507 RepID=UPI0030D5DFAC